MTNNNYYLVAGFFVIMPVGKYEWKGNKTATALTKDKVASLIEGNNGKLFEA